MGRQKRVIDKDWEAKAHNPYDFNIKKHELIGEYNDLSSSDEKEYETAMFAAELESGDEDTGYTTDRESGSKKTGTRRIVNRPATQPCIKAINGESRLCFKYPTKMCDSELSKRADKGFEELEFSIKFDIENVDIDKMTEKFKMDNSVYPRANVLPEKYSGNRWEYETEVNRLAWKLTALNPSLLYGKKGIVQRAVDSFRNLHRSTSSRRVVRMKKMTDGTLRKRQAENSPSTISVTWTQKGLPKKCKIRIDLESIDYEKIDDEFKLKYSVFSGEFDDQSFGLGKWENMNEDNLLAVKIAFLNVDNTSFWNAVKATDKVTMLRKAVEAYKAKKHSDQNKDSEQEEIHSGLLDMQQEEMYFIDPAEMSYREKSFYYYL
ncbi:hypothetical protein NEDG_00535 [Nematocida displodere]|uniref:DUF8032 domain-containing protein n=1 Tax=Nematocida displodere TaxID=1805483 RepID=A0A177EE18_9MICR|nr:hypothetical protein NEDG_00535 [Nematocida displodere]